MSTSAPVSAVAIAPLCSSKGRVYDWVIANVGNTSIQNARWRVFDSSQPSNSFEGQTFSLAPGQRIEVMNSPALGIREQFYRMMVYIVDDQSRQITLAVAPWDLSKCWDGLPPSEPTLAPSTPVPAPPVDATATPMPPVATIPATEPQATPTPSMTSTPLPTSTATPTPTASYEIQVVTKHWRNGRRMTKELFSKLALRGVLLIRGRAGTVFERRVPLYEFAESSFDYSTFVPAGSYRIRFGGGVRVVSVFRRNATSYTCTVGVSRSARNRCRGIPFALQPSSETKLTSSSGGGRS